MEPERCRRDTIARRQVLSNDLFVMVAKSEVRVCWNGSVKSDVGSTLFGLRKARGKIRSGLL